MHHSLITEGYETAIALVVSFIVWRLCIAAIDRFFARRPLMRQHPRVATYVGPAKSIVGVAILLTLALVLLNIWHVNVGPAILSAGAITAVLAFGAQWVVRDMLAGYSIFAENQFDVGDRVEITTGINSQITGVVEEIGLRTTRLIDRHGRTVYIPNGNIYVTTNFSKGVKRLELLFTLPWQGPVEVMKQELLKIAADAAAKANLTADSVAIHLSDFTSNDATFRVSIRASHTPIETDESTIRERMVAALQSKGWLSEGGTSEPAQPSGSSPAT